MTKAQPLFLKQHFKAANGAVVTIQHEHRQGGELSRAVPAVAAVHHNRRFPWLHFVCDPQRSSQDQLQTQDQKHTNHFHCNIFYNVLSQPMGHYAHLDVLKPMSGLQIGEPVGVLDIGVDNFLQLAERLPHHVDIVNIQENQLSVLIGILAFISTPFHLWESRGCSGY